MTKNTIDEHKIYYLGPKGTFGEEAAIKYAKSNNTNNKSRLVNLTLIEKPSHEAIAREIAKNGSVGVIGYYNYLEGLVQECVDLIYENNLHIIDTKRITITLAMGRHTTNSNNSIVYSHPKALAQCSNFLYKNYPDINLIETPSTTDAINKVLKEKKGLVIAKKESLKKCHKKGIEIIANDIGNNKNNKQNYTDFYVVSKTNKSISSDANTTMFAVVPHIDRVGLLQGILSQISFYGINIHKIHSRPAIDGVNIYENEEPQMFYLEVGVNPKQEEFKRLIDSLNFGLKPKGSNVEVVRVLGAYYIQK
ncbi:MAG: prephenate dehydratase domain-containing protein [Candidatus Woesearchaeota archaeon]|jgi:prephenate dehydratase